MVACLGSVPGSVGLNGFLLVLDLSLSTEERRICMVYLSRGTFCAGLRHGWEFVLDLVGLDLMRVRVSTAWKVEAWWRVLFLSGCAPLHRAETSSARQEELHTMS